MRILGIRKSGNSAVCTDGAGSETFAIRMSPEGPRTYYRVTNLRYSLSLQGFAEMRWQGARRWRHPSPATRIAAFPAPALSSGAVRIACR